LGFVVALIAAGAPPAAVRTVTLAVKNMYCSACPYIVRRSLAAVPGIENVAVSYSEKTATVTFDDQKVTLAALATATADAGYPSRPIANVGVK
jgi:mercuric ion binding protein